MTLPLPAAPAEAIDQMIACAERVLLCLVAEGEALVEDTPTGLERVCAAKLSEVRALHRLGAPLVGAGVPATWRVAGGISGPHAGPTGERWKQLRSMIARCEEANRANGVLLDQRRRRTGGLLAALTRHHAPVYGRAGYVAASLPGRVSGCA